MSVIDELFDTNIDVISPEGICPECMDYPGDDVMAAHFFRELYTRYPVRTVRVPRRSPYREVEDTDVSKLKGVEKASWDEI